MNPALNRTYGYDILDRLTEELDNVGTTRWAYDANGNRLSVESGVASYAYAYPAASNRLESVSGPVVKTYTYAAAGNPLSDGTTTFTFNAAGRLSSVLRDGKTNAYRYNALGERVIKSGAYVTNGPWRFVYDSAGRLVGEYDKNNALRQETVWLEDLPVAVIKRDAAGQFQTYPIHADHLNTARAIQDSQNRVVWRWNSNAFGQGSPLQDPDGDGIAFEYNPRLPGQYWDKETGLHYNYFRDYEPGTGRYVEADPIGLEGGLNLYAYVDGNPISLTDPYGLAGIRTNNGGDSAQNRFARRHPQLPPNIPRLRANDNASEAAGYYNDEGQYVCLRWSCGPKPDNGQCNAGHDPRGNIRSANDYLPAATDPNNPPSGCTCDEPRFRATNAPSISPYDFLEQAASARASTGKPINFRQLFR